MISVPNTLDGRSRIIGVAFLELIPRLIVESPSFEVLDGADDGLAIAGERHPRHRGQRIHDGHHVGRGELILDEIDERLADRHVVPALDVVIVQQQHEQPDVGPRRLPLLVEERSDLEGRCLCLLERVDLDDGERLDRLRFAVFLDPELILLQVEQRLPLTVGNDDVHANEVDAGPDRRLTRLLLLGRLRGRRLRGRLLRGRLLRWWLLIRLACRWAGGDENNGRKAGAEQGGNAHGS